MAFVPALILQQQSGITPKIGVSPRAPKKLIQQLIVAYGVQAIIHTKSSRHTIFARVSSISSLNINEIWRVTPNVANKGNNLRVYIIEIDISFGQ